MNTTNAVDSANTMRFGRAMHMDLTRADDEKLNAAIRTLTSYDDAGLASAYTQDKIDTRLAEIDDEQDRRAGCEHMIVGWNPNASHHVIGVASTIAEFNAETGERIVAAPRDFDDGADPVADTTDMQDADAVEDSAMGISVPDGGFPDGLVPGERSAI
jgi:hypothetical protein